MHEIPESPEGMFLHSDLLLVAAHRAWLIVYEPDGGDLTELGRVPTTNPWSVAARGDHAWVADGAGGLTTIDLSNPAVPRVIASLELGGSAKDIPYPMRPSPTSSSDAACHRSWPSPWAPPGSRW
jgi:hypothetical protein